MTSSKSKPSLMVPIIVSVILFSAIGTGAYFYLDYQKTQNIAAQENKLKQKKHSEAVEKKRAAIQKLYDEYLNSFITDLDKAMRDYKQSRAALKFIRSPSNFSTPERAQKTHTQLKKGIAPALREKSYDIIDTFSNYDQKVQDDLKNKQSAIEAVFLEKWTAMSREKLVAYINFFEKEEKIIRAHEDLVDFYYAKSQAYTVDLTTNKFVFKRPSDRKKASFYENKVDVLITE